MTYNRELCYYFNNEIVEYEWNSELIEASKHFFIGNTITNFNIDEFDNIELLLVDFSTIKISSEGIIEANFAKEQRGKEMKTILRSKSLNELLLNSKFKLLQHSNHRKLIINTINFQKVHVFKLNNETYFGTQFGLHEFDNENTNLTKTILTNYSITGITYDFEGGLWCSSLSQGVIYIPNHHIQTFNTLLGKNDQFCGIIPQNEKLIFAYGKAMNFYEFIPISNSLRDYTSNLSIDAIDKKYLKQGLKLENPVYLFGSISAIQTICSLDSNRTLTYNPHQELVVQTNTLLTLPFHELSLLPQIDVFSDKFNNDWKLNKELNTFQMISNPEFVNRGIKGIGQKVLKIFKDSKGAIWLGTVSGLYTFNSITEEVEEIHPFHKFTKYRIQDIVESIDGTIFFATKAYGIFTLKDSIVNEINSSNGLISNTINQLLLDSTKNQVLAGTNNGISRLSFINGVWTPKSIITKHDGLELTDVRQLAFHNDDLFFANNTGVSKIKKSKLNQNTPPPILYIKSLKSNQVNKLISEPILLNYDSNDIQIDYQAISFKFIESFPISIQAITRPQ